MEARQIKAASVSRKTTCWKLSLIPCIILIICAAGILFARFKPETGPSQEIDRGGKVFRFDVPLPIGSLDPKPDEGGSAALVFKFLYSYLFIINEDGQLDPDLATSWSYDKESFTLTIQIRNGAQFHDGSSVTAYDVAYSIQGPLKKALPSTYHLVDGITAVNETTIVICLKKDDPAFLEKICGFEIVKLPKLNEKNNLMNPIGSGPFKFGYRIGSEEVGLMANENYYRGRPRIDNVIFYYQADREKSWARLLAGKTDLVRGILPNDYQMMKHYEDRFYFKTNVDLFQIVLRYNTNDFYLNDPRVRMALSCAVDRQHIVRVIMSGIGVVPPGVLGYYFSRKYPDLKPIPYDPSKSIRLLNEAGWTYDSRGTYLQKDGKPFELTILFIEENRLHESIARYVQLCLNDLGIRVHVQPLHFGEFVQRYWNEGDFQAVITEFQDARNAMNSIFEDSPVLRGNRSDPRIEWIVNKVRHETDHSRKEELLKELTFLLESLQPSTTLVQKVSLDVLSRRFNPNCDLSNINYTFKLWQISPVSEQ